MQQLTGIKPDLTTLGKVIGGGMPLAAFGGRRAVMEVVAPLGPMYQAGTLSGNPLAVAAGLKTLEIIRRPGAFAQLTARTARLAKELAALAARRRLPFVADSEGGMFGFFFHGGPVRSLEEAKSCDTERFKRFFHGMLGRGVYLAPSAFEAGFVSMAHTDADLDQTLKCAEAVFAELA
jgi:glutamate-1-semialdehyde 2,1-aminomutase